jgi:cyanophycinase
MAVGGGEFGNATEVRETFLDLVKGKKNPHLVVMTVATNEPEKAAKKYDTLFRKHKINHVSIIDVSERNDAFDEKALKKISEADALFFTGGDQLNVTSLMGGTPLHNLIHEKYTEGFIIAGTSAGAMMMSNSMIVSGVSDEAPMVGGVEIAPGMDLISDTTIDTHFSQRGRHGRLLTAIAHYRQNLGIGIDEQTAIVVRGNEFRVVGSGAVTIIDGSQIRHSNLPYRREDEPLGLCGVTLHVLPAGYKYDLKKRQPISPSLRKIVGSANGN